MAPAILDLIENVVLKDAAYVERLKRRYRMFRDVVDGKTSRATKSAAAPTGGTVGVITSGPFPRLGTAPAEPTSPTGKVGRNDPCPCGSGRKHKKCCMGKE